MWVKCGQEFTLGQNSWNKLVKYLLSGSVGDMFCLFYLRHCSALAAHSKCLGCLSQNPALHTILQILNSAVGQLPNVFSWTGEFGKRRDTRVTYPSVCLCLIKCVRWKSSSLCCLSSKPEHLFVCPARPPLWRYLSLLLDFQENYFSS